MKDDDLPVVSRIELAKAKLALKDAQSKQRGVQAKMDSGKAELKALEEQIDLLTLRSPVSGHLGMIQVVPGQTIAAGALVAEVVDLEEVDVLCWVPPNLIDRFKLNQPAQLEIEDHEAKSSLIGKVIYIGPVANPDTGNFPTKVRFANPEEKIRGNAVVHISVLTKAVEKRWCIPLEALMEDDDPPGVVIVETKKEEKDGKEETKLEAKKLHAEVGVRAEVLIHDKKTKVVEILKLEDPEKPDEKIDFKDQVFVTEGAYGLKDEDELKIEEEK
jgi:RND family efflux transporter MFP subunit